MSGFFQYLFGAGGAIGGGVAGGMGGAVVGGAADAVPGAIIGGAGGAAVGGIGAIPGAIGGAIATGAPGATAGALAGAAGGGYYGYTKGSAAGASLDQAISDWWNADQMANQAHDGPVPAKVAPAGAQAQSQEGAVTANCATGNCDEDCPSLVQLIESQAMGVQRRLEDLVEDQHDLYNTARGLADNWGKGTWQGHLDRYEDERETLRTNIARADAKGCHVSDWARDVANEGPPTRPGY